MIKASDLSQRQYDGKSCVRFAYRVKDDEGQTVVVARFERSPSDPGLWSMEVNLPRTDFADSQNYVLTVEPPKRSTPLEHIAAYGLIAFQQYLKAEINFKSGIDFAIGSVVPR